MPDLIHSLLTVPPFRRRRLNNISMVSSVPSALSDATKCSRTPSTDIEGSSQRIFLAGCQIYNKGGYILANAVMLHNSPLVQEKAAALFFITIYHVNWHGIFKPRKSRHSFLHHTENVSHCSFSEQFHRFTCSLNGSSFKQIFSVTRFVIAKLLYRLQPYFQQQLQRGANYKRKTLPTDMRLTRNLRIVCGCLTLTSVSKLCD